MSYAIIEQDNESFTRSKALRDSYEMWCEDNCEPPRRPAVFQKAISKKLTQIDNVEPGSDGQARGYHGVRLRVYYSEF